MNRWLRIGFIVVVLIIIAYSFLYLQTVISYVLIAGALSFFGRPIMNFFQTLRIGKIHLPNWLSALLTIACFFGVIALFVAAFVPLIIDQINLVVSINPNAVIQGLEDPIQRLDNFLSKYSLIDTSEKPLSESLKDQLSSLMNSANISNVFTSVFGVVNNIFSYFIAVFSITFIAFFFLADKDLLYRSVFSTIPTQFEQRFDVVVNTAKELLTRYMYGILIQVTLITIYITFLMMILGVKNALLIGLFTGLVNIIPYVGPIIGLSFGVFVAITTNLGLDFYSQMLPLLAKVAAVFVSMQLLDNMFLQPLIFSSFVRAHPLEIFLLILIAGTIAGIPGMILAIPTYTILRLVAKEFLSEFKVVKSLTKHL